MLANAAGPIMTLYLPALRLLKLEFVGTAAWFFLIVNLLKLPFSYSLGVITGPSPLPNCALLPMVALGILSGRARLARIRQKWFETLLLIFAAAAALRLLF